jgi:hypothetical protein
VIVTMEPLAALAGSIRGTGCESGSDLVPACSKGEGGRQTMEEYLAWALLFVAVTAVVTAVVFWRRRSFERGPRKGTAENPAAVRRQNPPDDAGQDAKRSHS